MAHAAFNWDDPFLLDQQLTDDERMVRDAANAYCQERLLPRVIEGFRNGATDPAIFREMGALGLLGPTIPEQYGGPGLNYVCLRPDRARSRARRLGLPLDGQRAELAGDGADQRIRHRSAEAEVPAQARHRRMDRLLRPDRARPRLRPRQHGHARARRWPGGYSLSGAKMWISNSPIADVFVVWAKEVSESGTVGPIRGFVLEKGMKGLTRPGHPRQGRPARLASPARS